MPQGRPLGGRALLLSPPPASSDGRWFPLTTVGCVAHSFIHSSSLLTNDDYSMHN